MKWRWWIFAKIFPKEYDLLFDVMHEYQAVEHATGPDPFDQPVWKFHDEVEWLGVRMGCWRKKDVTIWDREE